MNRSIRLILPPWAPTEVPPKLRAIALEAHCSEPHAQPLRNRINRDRTLVGFSHFASMWRLLTPLRT